MGYKTKCMANKFVKNLTHSEIENFSKLGKRVEIGSTAKVSINKPGFKMEFYTPTVDVVIGIGKDHVARLVMDEDAWKALKKGQKVEITSLPQFKKKFL